VKTLFVLLIFVISIHFDCCAQSKDSSESSNITQQIINKTFPARYIEAGLSAIAYKGDLSSKYANWSSALNIAIRWNKKKRLNGHINLMIGKVTGQNYEIQYSDNATPPNTANNFFKSSIFSLNYDLQVNLIKKEHFILYIGQGIGLLRFLPKDENNESLIDKGRTRAKNETYNNLSIILPSHAGFIFTLKNNFGIGFQAGWLNPVTDYIDNISELSNYAKKDNLLAYKFSFLIPMH
jgi:hypothetical protein